MEIIKAVLETLKETGNGAPETPIFMAFQANGATLEQFNSLMGKMESLSLITRSNHTVSLTPTGELLLSRMG